MKIKRQFGKRIKELRIAIGMTQELLAEKLHVHRNTLARIESGENFVTAETLDLLQKELGVDYCTMFDFKTKIKTDANKSLETRLNNLDSKDKKFFISAIDASLKIKKNKSVSK